MTDKDLRFIQSQIPPHDIEVENAVIGSCLCDSDNLPPLAPSEFFSERNRVVWQAMIDLHEIDGKFDLITVAAHLKSRGLLEDAGGPSHLGLCVENGVLAHRVKEMARIVREHARQRAIIAIGSSMIHEGFEGRAKHAELARRIEELPGPMASALYDPAINWTRIAERWGQNRVLTGYAKLDEVSQGLEFGEMIVIAGRTSHGKTAFATNLLRRLAGVGHVSDYITLEETDDAITRRWVSQVSGVHNYRIKEGSISPSEIEQCEAAVAELQTLPLTCTALDTVGNLEEDTVLGVAAHSPAHIVVVDHIQKISTRDQSRVYGLERVINRFHALAIRQQKSIILLSQLSRTMETEKRRPMLSDMRDSGAQEMAARKVFLLYWPWKTNPDENPAEHYEVDVAKNSDGGTQSVPMVYDPRCGRFADPNNGGVYGH